ncbi:MAG: amidohydrolase family protein [Gemmatimonadales bacterium]|nr:amidohydrolase family protein [Gemmatimonadales bacterium]MDZ4389033.1 amidohydrolase family protein [Gemmatimonadales bacterium]
MSLRSLAILALAAAPLAAQSTAFVGVTVLPMDTERTIADQTVVVTDGRIAAIGPAATTAVPRDATRIDGRGKFLMPGLAEMHAHVPPQQPADQLLEDIMFLYVANGVTTIRGMLGSPYQLDLRERLARGEMLGPRFYVGAPSLNGNSAPDPATATRLVREHRAAGYDLVKIHPGPSRATYDAALATGREVGITLGGHVPAGVGIDHAIASGQSTIDHLDGYIEGSMDSGAATPVAGWQSVTTERLRALARDTKAAGLWVVPTMFLWQHLYWPPDGEVAAAWPEMRYVPRPWVTGWQNQARGRASQAAQQGLTAADTKVLYAKRNQLLKLLADEGETILMGTDSPQMFNVPGFALHREIQVMAEAGLTPWQVLVSGTRDVASYVRRSLGKPAPFGTVAVGQEADLVLLDGNPLASLDNLTERAGVMVRGRWISREELDRGLTQIAGRYAQ